MAEILFEKFSVPAMFTSKDSILECYACGRTSGLVIDIGSSGTVITPVSDGFVDTRGLNRSIVGGRYLDDFTLSLIKRRLGSNPVQRFKINRSFNQERVLVVNPAVGLNNIHPTYESLMNLEIGRDVKETISRMAESTLFEADSRFASIPMIPYELPDGTVIDFGLERYQIAECLFDPSAIDLENIDMVTLGLNASEILPASTLEGIPRLVSDSVLRCEADIQSTLLSNLVIAGGGASVEGLTERIKAEVENVVHASSPGLKVKAISAGVNERALCAWLGGSILASLGSFHEMWYTKQEYEEFGSSLLDRKCP
jgi:actin-like protein 6A